MKLLVIGAGGHAKVVIDAARAAGMTVAGVVADDGDRHDLMGVPVSGDASVFGADAFIVAVGDNATRATLFSKYLQAGLMPATVVHPSVTVAEGVTLGEGTFLAAGVVVNADANVGRNVILNTGCTVDHDCGVGDHVHVGPGVNLCGGVRVGEGALVGVGACAVPLCRIGEWSVVGAGSAVTTDVPSAETWGGVPARPLTRRERPE